MHNMKKNILIFGLLSFLGGCGFQPLYVEKQGNSVWHYDGQYNTSTIQEMAQIKVEPIAERFGQTIRNELIDSLTPKGIPNNPKYRLYVSLQSKKVVQQALRDDITATRERVQYNVTYNMEKDSETLVEGNSVAFVSYDILANPYSTTFSRKKTEEDAAKIIANDIVLRLGSYFHSKQTKSGENSDF